MDTMYSIYILLGDQGALAHLMDEDENIWASLADKYYK